MVLFERVRFKNFGSFGNYFTDIEFKDHKMTLVTGANGHGKSYALLDSITFGLFGKPFRKINIPQLVNSINDTDVHKESVDLIDISLQEMGDGKNILFCMVGKLFEGNSLIHGVKVFNWKQ